MFEQARGLPWALGGMAMVTFVVASSVAAVPSLPPHGSSAVVAAPPSPSSSPDLATKVLAEPVTVLSTTTTTPTGPPLPPITPVVAPTLTVPPSVTVPSLLPIIPAPGPTAVGYPPGPGGPSVSGCSVTKTEGAITATFSVSSQVLKVGDTMAVSMVFGDPDSVGEFQCYWRFDFGDGGSNWNGVPLSCKSGRMSMTPGMHTYTRPGEFLVTMTVTSTESDEKISISIPARVCAQTVSSATGLSCAEPVVPISGGP